MKAAPHVPVLKAELLRVLQVWVTFPLGAAAEGLEPQLFLAGAGWQGGAEKISHHPFL